MRCRAKTVATGSLAAATLWTTLLTACGSPPPPVPNPETAGMEARVRDHIEEARRGVIAEPGSAEAWGRLGKVLDAHELETAAIEAYDQARRLDPEDARWPYFLARVLSFSGSDPERQEALLRETLTRRPGYAPAHLRLAGVLAQAGRLEEAEEAYRQASSLDGDLAPAHRGLGQVLLQRGRAEEAVEPLDRARELEPQDAAAAAALAQALQRIGRAQEARALADRARRLETIDAYPDPLLAEVSAEGRSSSIAFERGMALMQAGRFSDAIPQLQLVATVRRDDPVAHRELALAYQRTGQLDKAEQELRKALELRPQEGLWRVQLGEVLLQQENPEAIQELRRARQDGFDPPYLGSLLGLALARQGNLQEGVLEMERAAARGPLPLGVNLEWGRALAQLGRYSEAEEQFRAALARDSGSAGAHLNLGLALEAQGKKQEAARHYREAMAIEPNPMAAQRLQALGAS